MQRCPIPKDYVIKAVETDEELRLANDLMAKSHFSDYFYGLRWLETCGAGYPGFRREHTRIAVYKGEIAGSLRLNTETIRLGEARLRMGGFGWVSTEPRHRNKGVCRALMLNALEYMCAHNYHVSMLFGIPNFYHRFGFATTLADYAILVEASEAMAISASGARIREVKPGEIAVLQKMHAANDADVACSLLRTAAHMTNRWERYKNVKVLTNAQGRVQAYFLANRVDDQLHVEEVGLADMSVCPEILSSCVRVASEEAVSRIRFLCPPPHPFARFLLQYKSIHEMRIVRDSGGMMAFVNLGEALESMIPEWESLLAKSSLRDTRIEITFLVDRVSYRVRAQRGAIDVASTPGVNKVGLTCEELMHLITGYRHAQDIINIRRRILSPESRALLEVLFPKRTPYVWLADRF